MLIGWFVRVGQYNWWAWVLGYGCRRQQTDGLITGESAAAWITIMCDRINAG